MVHHPCLIFFQNDQYLSSFQVILSPKSNEMTKNFSVGGPKIFLDPSPYTKTLDPTPYTKKYLV